jgi:hypothetical protein
MLAAGDTYQVAHHDLRFSRRVGRSSWCGRPRRSLCGSPSALPNSPHGSSWGSLAGDATTSTAAATTTAATVGADDLIETLVELGRHLS